MPLGYSILLIIVVLSFGFTLLYMLGYLRKKGLVELGIVQLFLCLFYDIKIFIRFYKLFYSEMSETSKIMALSFVGINLISPILFWLIVIVAAVSL